MGGSADGSAVVAICQMLRTIVYSFGEMQIFKALLAIDAERLDVNIYRVEKFVARVESYDPLVSAAGALSGFAAIFSLFAALNQRYRWRSIT